MMHFAPRFAAESTADLARLSSSSSTCSKTLEASACHEGRWFFSLQPLGICVELPSVNVLGYACRCVAGRVVGASAEIVAGSAVVVRRAEDGRERVHL